MQESTPTRFRLSGALLPLLAAVLAAAVGCSSNPTAPPVEIPLDSLILSPDTLFLRVGESASFRITAVDSGGQPASGVRATWTTSDSDRVVVAVSGNGRATGLGEGTAAVYATSGGASDSAVVVVGPAADGWYVQASNANGADLNGVFFQSDGRTGWVVGHGGKILATDNAGVDWDVQVSGTAFNLNGVWFTGPAEGWAVGNSGTVLHTIDGGAHWSRVTVNAGEGLMDVTFANPAMGWIVGGSGVILRTRDGGSSWQKQYRSGFTLHGVSFADTSHGWAVGDNGVIVGTHDGGASWFVVQPAVTAQSLKAVWRRAPSRAWAAGSQGVAPRTVVGPDSTRWELRNTGAENQLEGICFATDVVGYTVGWHGNGAVLRTDDGGLSWSYQVPNTTFRLHDVFFVDTERGWAVGANGTILHTGTGGRP